MAIPSELPQVTCYKYWALVEHTYEGDFDEKVFATEEAANIVLKQKFNSRDKYQWSVEPRYSEEVPEIDLEE